MGQGTDRSRTATGTGEPPAPPEPPSAVTTDEGPMRRELRRQIARLEAGNTQFVNDNCPWEPIPSTPRRGPAVLSNAELEQVRDELIEARAALHDRTVQRASEPADVRPRLGERLTAWLRRRR